MNPVNTHSYDRRLDLVKEELKPHFAAITFVSDDQKQESFRELTERLSPKLSEVERSFLTKLVSEKDKYYDPVNDLRVDDLLYLCYIRIKEDNEDFLNNFRQQLLDLRTGSCVQGRSIRLLQLLYAFE